MNDKDRALLDLLRTLDARGYSFITPTPATHARVVRRKRLAEDLRDILGWSLPFQRDTLDPDLFALLERADALEQHDNHFSCRLRVSCLGQRLFLHSAYPTDDRDAVFFGPDSYRFAALLDAEANLIRNRRHIVDLGAGAGVGGLIAASHAPAARITLCDTNAKALRLAAINAAFAGVDIETIAGDCLASLPGDADCIIANPPYIVDDRDRAYRHGGAMHGGEVSLEWARAAAAQLAPGGVLILYTGSAIVAGRDELKDALREALNGFTLNYRELDPDVFGEELDHAAYADVERIAIVALTAQKPA